MARTRRRLEDMSRQELRAKAARAFQEMVRAEWGAWVGDVVHANAAGDIVTNWSNLGEVTCVTCGKVAPWRGTNQMDSGHCVSGRRDAVLFSRKNCRPQCKECNKWRGGKPAVFRKVLAAEQGAEWLEAEEKAARALSIIHTREDYIHMVKMFRRTTKACVAEMSLTRKPEKR